MQPARLPMCSYWGERLERHGELRGPQAGGRRQLGDEYADAALRVNAAGFFISGRSWSTTARSTTPTSSWTGIFFTQTVARSVIEHGPRRVGHTQLGMETVW